MKNLLSWAADATRLLLRYVLFSPVCHKSDFQRIVKLLLPLISTDNSIFPLLISDPT